MIAHGIPKHLEGIPCRIMCAITAENHLTTTLIRTTTAKECAAAMHGILVCAAEKDYTWILMNLWALVLIWMWK